MKLVGACAIGVLVAGSAHAQERKFSWICNVRASYALNITDAGKAEMTGTAMPGSNHLLLAITKPEDGRERVLLSAILQNKAVPQMRADAPQAVTMDMDGGQPTSVYAGWTGIGGAESIVLEKSAKSWRFVLTSTIIVDEETALKFGGSAGPQVSTRSGDSVLTP